MSRSWNVYSPVSTTVAYLRDGVCSGIAELRLDDAVSTFSLFYFRIPHLLNSTARVNTLGDCTASSVGEKDLTT